MGTPRSVSSWRVLVMFSAALGARSGIAGWRRTQLPMWVSAVFPGQLAGISTMVNSASWLTPAARSGLSSWSSDTPHSAGDKQPPCV
jgi:hypothetical protein